MSPRTPSFQIYSWNIYAIISILSLDKRVLHTQSTAQQGPLHLKSPKPQMTWSNSNSSRALVSHSACLRGGCAHPAPATPTASSPEGTPKVLILLFLRRPWVRGQLALDLRAVSLWGGQRDAGEQGSPSASPTTATARVPPGGGGPSEPLSGSLLVESTNSRL